MRRLPHWRHRRRGPPGLSAERQRRRTLDASASVRLATRVPYAPLCTVAGLVLSSAPQVPSWAHSLQVRHPCPGRSRRRSGLVYRAHADRLPSRDHALAEQVVDPRSAMRARHDGSSRLCVARHAGVRSGMHVLELLHRRSNRAARRGGRLLGHRPPSGAMTFTTVPTAFRGLG